MIILSIFLLTSCNTNNEDEPHIEGTLIAHGGMISLLTVFVEDSISGNNFEYPETEPTSSDMENYEAEIYRLLLDKETIFIFNETGEELTVNMDGFPYHLHGFFQSWSDQVEVNVKEEFEREILTDRSTPVSMDASFIPIYTADEIFIESPDKELLIERYRTHTSTENDYKQASVLTFLDDSFSQDSLMTNQQHFQPYQKEDQWINNQVFFNDEVGIYDHFIDSYPTYYVLDEEGKVFETGDLNDVITYIEEKKEFEINEEWLEQQEHTEEMED